MPKQIPLGILYMIGASLAFALGHAVTKWQVASYPVGEILFVRSTVSFAVISAFVLPRTGLAVFRTNRLRDHVLRSFSQACSQTFIVIAFSLMPLAGAVAINFSAPLFATLVSTLWFKEPAGPARWTALLVGFGGVLIVTNPGTGTFSVGALFALANAILYGSVTAGVRRMTSTESPQTLTMYQLGLLTCFFALELPFGFEMPTSTDAGLMVLNGTVNALGQYWWTRSLHLAPASAVGPFYYMTLVWVIFIGFVLWGDVPTLALLAGSGIVVASGLLLLWHESKGRAAAATGKNA